MCSRGEPSRAEAGADGVRPLSSSETLLLASFAAATDPPARPAEDAVTVPDRLGGGTLEAL
ncbi:hypothetical protein E7Y31_13570 [Candidatus Frankia alpina]|uniref:Uncharacterized protein n=1 Tax=Candidatus Frankia alpina TaxID=2699483 RepID=A0A4S5EP62_9ACTN|nr:hypothetical protein E7Y31_13570 [Candidatus Frankia alpina]